MIERIEVAPYCEVFYFDAVSFILETPLNSCDETRHKTKPIMTKSKVTNPLKMEFDPRQPQRKPMLRVLEHGQDQGSEKAIHRRDMTGDMDLDGLTND